jgi:signal peptidase II
MNRIWKMALLIVGIILADQLTKGAIQSKFQLHETIDIIDGFFNLTYVRNPGAAFGFLADAHENIRRPLFLFIPVGVCIFLVKLIWVERNKSFLLCLTYSLILAGAIGNLIDRFALGYVVDFFDFYYGSSHFPAFNIADSAITIAAFLLIYDFILSLKRENEEKKSES